jgi:hypothetical protein
MITPPRNPALPGRWAVQQPVLGSNAFRLPDQALDGCILQPRGLLAGQLPGGPRLYHRLELAYDGRRIGKLALGLVAHDLREAYHPADGYQRQAEDHAEKSHLSPPPPPRRSRMVPSARAGAA